MFYALGAVWGLAMGALVGNILSVICLFCETHQMALLFGLHLLAEGLGGVVGTPLSGMYSRLLVPLFPLGLVFT